MAISFLKGFYSELYVKGTPSVVGFHTESLRVPSFLKGQTEDPNVYLWIIMIWININQSNCDDHISHYHTAWKCRNKQAKQLWVFLPSVNHLIALFQPADSRHLAAWSSSIHIDYHVVLSHQHLQAAHYIPTLTCKEKLSGGNRLLEETGKATSWRLLMYIKCHN